MEQKEKSDKVQKAWTNSFSAIGNRSALEEGEFLPICSTLQNILNLH